MAYLKYKEISNYFYFSKFLLEKELPSYVLDYIFEDEIILASYKTTKDHGVFTDKKIVLFDNTNFLSTAKQIYTIPYKCISTISVIFNHHRAEISLFLDSGYPLRIKFINMNRKDKRRLRTIYMCISRSINGQKLSEKDVKSLQEDDINLDD